MKNILLGLFTFFTFGLHASHILGGSVHWTKTSNGQFIFEVHVMKECGAGSASYIDLTLDGPNGSIALTQDTVFEVSPVCTGGGQVSCGISVPGMAAVKVHVLKSAAISLSGTPPASGWDFVWTSAGRQFAVNMVGGANYCIKSTMYPGGDVSSPKLVGDVNMIISPSNKTISKIAIGSTSEDSLYYSLAPAHSTVTGLVSYASDFTYSSPFPSNLSNPANGAISIDGNSGLITLDAQVGVSGYYVLAVAIEQWRNGVKLSRTLVDHHVFYKANTTANDEPDVNIDTSAFPNIIQTDQYSYKTFVTIGDTVEFNISGLDSDINSTTSLLQQINFDANGSALSSMWGGLNTYMEHPVLTPVSPQTGFTNSYTNKVNFKWAVGNEHYIPNNNSHFFTFTFKDDECPYPGMTSVTLQVVVQKAVSITADTLYVCAGDSIQLAGITNNGMYSWTPTAGLSDAAISNPKASPSASGYYYLSNGNGAIDSVYVQVKQKGTIDLAFANGKLEITDTNGTSNRIWYYNGVPFYYPYDTLTPFGFGDYWVKAQDDSCALISNTFNVNTGHSFSVFDPANGGYNGTSMAISGSIGTTFSINQGATINSVTIVGLEDLHKSGTGYDLNLKVYDANQVEIFSKDVTLNPPFFGPLHIEVGYAITANADYTVAVSGDTAYSFKLFENVSYPATPHHNGITVTGSYEGAAGQFPTQPSNYLLPFTINTDAQVVSIEEQLASRIQIYPNPSSGFFTIQGLVGKSQIQIVDMQGKMVESLISDEESVEVTRKDWPAGLYFVKIKDENNTTIKKLYCQ